MIYLDHNATAPVRVEVREAMARCLAEEFGNPSSAHQVGGRARAAVEAARRTIAEVIAARPSEVVFTSGGTEGNNLALFGLVAGRDRPHLVVSPIEHPSVIAPAREVERRGGRVTWLPVNPEGRVDPADVAAAIDRDTAVVSAGWANNEIGTVQDIAAIAEVCRRRGVRLHVDAVQALGKIPISVRDVDTCSVSAHKIGGPKGVGALFVRGGVTLPPLVFGGEQERGVRPGTENLPGIVGFAAAARCAQPGARWVELRERLWCGIASCGGVRRNSPAERCLPNTLHVSFAEIRGETLVAALDLEGVAVSAGSACAAGASEPSHILRALGRGENEAREGLRLSLGVDTTSEEIDEVVRILTRVVRRVRGVRGQWAANG